MLRNAIKQADIKDRIEAIRVILSERAATNAGRLSAQDISDVVAIFKPDFIATSGSEKAERIDRNGASLPEIPKDYGNVFYLDLYFKPKGKYKGMVAFMYDPIRNSYALRFTHHE
ncbi:MAG: hypothetical protein Q8R04_04745 [Nanoarchaeota archaeon]|nr:hypothetical protein [Nanoarchaeota archaeon]